MSKHVKRPLPDWFNNPIAVITGDYSNTYYVCTECGAQSLGGIYTSLCLRCNGISSDPKSYRRYSYLCTTCVDRVKPNKCRCYEPKPIIIKQVTPSPSPPPPPPPPVCCCDCLLCNFLCRCVCCCLTCRWRTSSCDSCCASSWNCSCCTCHWTWCGCDCSPPID